MSQSKSFRLVQTIESTVRFCSYHEWYEEKLLLTKEYIQLSESLTISNINNIKIITVITIIKIIMIIPITIIRVRIKYYEAIYHALIQVT